MLRFLALALALTCVAATCKQRPGTSGDARITVVPCLWAESEPPPWSLRFDTCVYQRHNANESDYVPNRAYEAGVYLRYIVDHYEDLSDVTVFVQEDALPEVGRYTSCLRVDKDWGWAPIGGAQGRFVASRGLEAWGYAPAVHACWQNLAAAFGVRLPSVPVVSFYCCAYFAMTKNAIRRHPLSLYIAAYKLLVLQPHCATEWQGSPLTFLRGYSDDKHANAGAFEHLQQHLIGGFPLDAREFGGPEWCERFRPNCPGSPCRGALWTRAPVEI